MILFLFYAVFVWYLCFRFRRQWTGILCFVCAMGSLWLLADLYRLAIRWAKLHSFSLLDTRNDGQLFLMLLAVEAVIVAMVGIFFWCLPRHVALVPCRRCRYELSGLDDTNPTCPECGLHSAAAVLKERTCPTCQTLRLWRVDRSCCESCDPPRQAARISSTNAPDHPLGSSMGRVSHPVAAISLATDGSSPQPAAQDPEAPR
ncbi:MAG: hypothetical protein NTV94_13810 [Planctomycetota bacterium]|nr:hypothetical protein [Planctomycetota bacterium]